MIHGATNGVPFLAHGRKKCFNYSTQEQKYIAFGERSKNKNEIGPEELRSKMTARILFSSGYVTSA